MKTNAPEKIYVDSKAIGDNISTTVQTKQQDYPTCTEYIRADVFIEKAREYLMEYEFNDSPTIADRRKRVENFVNYMKEE